MVDWSALLAFAAARPGEPLALATLVGRRGSSYLAPGARLLIADDGAHIGALSAGCFEERLAAGAREAGLGAPARRLEVDTLPRYGCPGVLEIFLEPLAPTLLPAVGEALTARRAFTLATRLGGERAGTVLVGESGVAEAASAEFLQHVAPRPRVVVVGGEGDAAALAAFVAVLGWEQVACAPDIPAAALLARCPPDERTAVVLLTHQFTQDLRLLRALLPAGYPYVGLLGSRRRRESLLAELGAEGAPIDEASLAALRAPVGLDLGADTPASVALAIVAEIQAAWNGAAGGPLRDRAGPVHAVGPGRNPP
jgi:xanthine dehydrogenase accessory factor